MNSDPRRSSAYINIINVRAEASKAEALPSLCFAHLPRAPSARTFRVSARVRSSQGKVLWHVSFGNVFSVGHAATATRDGGAYPQLRPTFLSTFRLPSAKDPR